MQNQERAEPKRETVIIVNQSQTAGILSVVFGALSIFILGFIFVPLSLICGIVALAKKQLLLGIIGLILCLVGFLTSPALWAITGMSAIGFGM